MKKLHFILIFLLLLTGCTSKKVNTYKKISDIVVSLYKTKNYDRRNLSSNEIKMIEEHISRLENNGPINISKFAIYQDAFKTDLPNSEHVYVVDDKCYINYADIDFLYDEGAIMSDMATLVCNGYLITFGKDSVTYDYETIIQNPKYNYYFEGYYKDDNYNFVYKSYYDGSGLVVTVGNDVDVSFKNVDDISLKTISKSSVSAWNIISIVIGFAIIGAVALVKKNNYD